MSRKMLARTAATIALVVVVVGATAGAAAAAIAWLRAPPAALVSALQPLPSKATAAIKSRLRAHRPPTPEDELLGQADPERARQIRKQLLDEVWLDAGAAALAGDRPLRTEETGVVDGDGFRVRKLRVEVMPDVWMPALLHEPVPAPSLAAPIVLSFNGHSSGGAITDARHEARAVHLARQGLWVLAVEAFDNGELQRTSGNGHHVVHHFDLVGIHGVGIFTLALRRLVDTAVALPGIDPARVAAIGLSGGGWQALLAGALDERVTLVNSVAGFAPWANRVARDADLGDSEQTPAGFYRHADYTTLAALVAPRPLLLSYNEPDSCCFRASQVLPGLEPVIAAVYAAAGAAPRFRTHTSTNPGTHNFDADNRQALYRFLIDQGFTGDRPFSLDEAGLAGRLPAPELLKVGGSAGATLKSVALSVVEATKTPAWPASPEGVTARQRELRQQLRALLAVGPGVVVGAPRRGKEIRLADGALRRSKIRVDGIDVTLLSIGAGEDVTLVLGEPNDTCVASSMQRAVDGGRRAVLLEPIFSGGAHQRYGDPLLAMMLGAIDQPALGIQVAQLHAAVGTLGKVFVVACGDRASLLGLVAAALDDDGQLERLDLIGLTSWDVLVAANRSIHKRPEMFPFGIARLTSIGDLLALAAPRPVRVVSQTVSGIDLERAVAVATTLGAPPPEHDGR